MNYLFFFGKKNFNSFLFFFVNVLLNRYHDLTMNIRISECRFGNTCSICSVRDCPLIWHDIFQISCDRRKHNMPVPSNL